MFAARRQTARASNSIANHDHQTHLSLRVPPRLHAYCLGCLEPSNSNRLSNTGWGFSCICFVPAHSRALWHRRFSCDRHFVRAILIMLVELQASTQDRPGRVAARSLATPLKIRRIMNWPKGYLTCRTSNRQNASLHFSGKHQ